MSAGETAAALIARAGDAGVGVVRIEDRDTIAELMVSLTVATTNEIWSTLPGGPYRPDMLRSSWDEDTGLLRRGVACRAVYQADSARSPEVLRYLTEFAAEGAQVRVATLVRYRTIIADRRVAVVAVDEDSLRPPFLVVREPALVKNFVAQFAALWRMSHSVGVGPDDSLSTEMVRETLEILRSGATDEMTARQLGVSVRTVRRRVAAVMDLLGASSRFEAGVKAVEAGLL